MQEELSPNQAPEPVQVPGETPSVSPQKKKRALIIGLVGLVIIILVIVVALVFTNKQPAKTTPDTTSSQQASTAPPKTTAATDTQSLQNDLNAINASSSQDASNLDAANTSLNDQQQEITVPTN